MAPLSLSSGDLIADRRYEWARVAQDKDDFAAAADLLMQALELAPDYVSAWFALGEVRAKLGDCVGAIAAFEKACAGDPADRHGAALQLAWLGAQTPGVMPPAYIRAVFDQYAPGFDHALVERLGYRGPELLLGAVRAAGRRMKFGTALDLGCGTGLAGGAFRPFIDWLVGVDLSVGMIAQARAKGSYDRLVEGDVLQFLADEAVVGARYHLALAADVLVYFSDLAAVAAATARVLAPGAILAFTVETYDGVGVLLRDSLRYAHSPQLVRAALKSAGLALLSLDSAATRMEKGEPVPGLIAVAQA
jgi:predicted TPR repeat methyltransferase